MHRNQHLSFRYIVSTTSLAFVVSQLDVSIVNIALPAMAKAFSADIRALQWVADAYTVAFATVMLSAGGLSDRLGSKRIFQLGLLLFGIASTGCGPHNIAWAVRISAVISCCSLLVAAVLIHWYVRKDQTAYSLSGNAE